MYSCTKQTTRTHPMNLTMAAGPEPPLAAHLYHLRTFTLDGQAAGADITGSGNDRTRGWRVTEIEVTPDSNREKTSIFTTQSKLLTMNAIIVFRLYENERSRSPPESFGSQNGEIQ